MPRAWSRQRRKRSPLGIRSSPPQRPGRCCSSRCRPDSSMARLNLGGRSGRRDSHGSSSRCSSLDMCRLGSEHKRACQIWRRRSPERMPRAWSRQRRKRSPLGIRSSPPQRPGRCCSSRCRPDSSRVQLRLRGNSLRTHTPDRVSGGLAFGEFKSRAILQPRMQSSHSAALCREIVESDWYDPAGQSVQPVAKMPLYVPSGHSIGSTEPIGQYSPSGHGVQRDSSSRPVLSEYVPPGHARGELEASGQKWPGEHVRQLVRLLPS